MFVCACLLVTFFGRGLLNSGSARGAQKILGGTRCANLQRGADLDEALLSNLKTVDNLGAILSVSHSTNGAFACRAYASLTRGFARVPAVPKPKIAHKRLMIEVGLCP